MRLDRRPAVFISSPQRLQFFNAVSGRKRAANICTSRHAATFFRAERTLQPDGWDFSRPPRAAAVRISSFKSEFSSAQYTLPTRRSSGSTGESAMKKLKTVKAALVGAWLLGGVLLVGTGYAFKSAAAPDKNTPQKTPTPVAQSNNPADYVGADTCSACHEDQAKSFSHTAHAKLQSDKSWKGKVVGCESCHGPGKAHVEAVQAALDTGKDPDKMSPDELKIHSFKGDSPKQASETCLACHAGKEEHNNYRRGEHWRNDVGCTDCHSPHSGAPK